MKSRRDIGILSRSGIHPQAYAASGYVPGIYAILADANGNTTGGTPNVTTGTSVASGNGYAIIKADSSGEVVVNGQKFTAPASGSRVHP
jgi:hypothetical protein